MNAQKLQSSVECARQFHLLVNDRDHQIGGHSDPYLRLHCVGTCAVEVLDAQMLFDPPEEQLDAPAHLVEHGYGKRWDFQVVGEEDQFPVGFRVVIAHLPQKGGKGISRFGERGLAHMVASQAGEAVHGQRVMPGEFQFALGPRDEESPGICDAKEAHKIHVAAIHQIKCAGFKHEIVEPAHVVLTGSGDVNAGGNGPSQVDLGMHLDARFGLPEVGPREECQREIDGGRIEGVDRVVEIQAEIFSGIQRPGLADESFCKILPDSPVALVVGVRESGLGNRLRESKMMQSRRPRIQTRGDVAQSLAPGQLGEDDVDELLATAEVADTGLGVVAFHQAGKCLAIHEVEDLNKDVSSGVHRATPCRKRLKTSKA